MPRSNLPIPKDPKDCPPWLYEYLKSLRGNLNKVSVGIAQITRGEVPDGSGQPLGPDLSQYFYLPGRVNGQTGYGGRGSGENLILSSTNNTSKGKVHLGNPTRGVTLDEVSTLVGINKSSPVATLHVLGSLAGSGGTTLVSTTAGEQWGGERSGAGGAGTGQDSVHALITDDGITTYIAANPSDSVPVGTNPHKNGLAAVIVPGNTYTVSASIACFSANADITKCAWMVCLTDSNGDQWQSAATFNETVSPFLSGELSTVAQTFITVSRTVTCSGTPVLTGQTPNQLWMNCVMKNNLNVSVYHCVSYVAVSQAGAALIRWDLSSGTQSGQIDLVGRMGVGTGSATLDSELTVIPDAVATIGVKIKAVAAQTGDLLRTTNSSGTALSGFTSEGDPYLIKAAAVDAVLVSDASGVGAWKVPVAYDDDGIFYEDDTVYYSVTGP